MATGLALNTSDFDIAIRGIPIFTKEILSLNIQKLSDEISKQDFVIDIKPITTASVPIIKLVNLLEI